MRSTRGGQRGVILMVVLALLTLFQIVGLTFVFYGKTHNDADANWRASADALATRAREAAPVVREDLLDALVAGDLELPKSRAEVDGLREDAVALLGLLTKARDAERDEKERNRLERLRERADEVVGLVDRLRCYLRKIELGSNGPPR